MLLNLLGPTTPNNSNQDNWTLARRSVIKFAQSRAVTVYVKGDGVRSIGPIALKSETEQMVRAPYATCEEQTMMLQKKTTGLPTSSQP